MNKNKSEEPIIKRIKDTPKQQKTIIGVVGLLFLIIISVVIGYYLTKDNTKQKKLGTVKQEKNNIQKQIEAIDKDKKKNSTAINKAMAADEKVKLYKKVIKQYKKEKRDNDAFEMTMEFLNYIEQEDIASTGINVIKDTDTSILSESQKIDFYFKASDIYMACGFLEESSKYSNQAAKMQNELEKRKQKQ